MLDYRVAGVGWTFVKAGISYIDAVVIGFTAFSIVRKGSGDKLGAKISKGVLFDIRGVLVDVGIVAGKATGLDYGFKKDSRLSLVGRSRVGDVSAGFVTNIVVYPEVGLKVAVEAVGVLVLAGKT